MLRSCALLLLGRAWLRSGAALAAAEAAPGGCAAEGECAAELGSNELQNEDLAESLTLLQRRGVKEQAVDVGVVAEVAEDSSDVEGRSDVGSARRRRGGHHSAGGAGPPPAPAPAASGASSGDVVPTADELKTLAAVINRLWKIDAPYRLQPGVGFRLNIQNRAESLASGKDSSAAALFTKVDQRQLASMPCATLFLALLDNYERDTSKADKATAQRRREEDDFTKCVMGTPHMKYVYNVLVHWGTVTGNYAAFSKQVADIWFTAYSLKSRGPLASSGFEHTFVGEEKKDKRSHKQTITGLHNWLQFWREEQAKRINYLGYVGNKQGKSLVSVRFTWQDDDPELEAKSVSSFLVGTSPPFEMAMLTCAFLGFGGETKVSGLYFGNEGPAQLVAYSWKSQGHTVVRTAYLQS